MQFVLLALVVLPVLPDATFGPYSVFNPREMWLMAVLIVGLSLAGYIALKFFGERAGIVAGGLLGGLMSSTATTVSWARLTSGRARGLARGGPGDRHRLDRRVRPRAGGDRRGRAAVPGGGRATPADPGGRHGGERAGAVAAHARRRAGPGGRASAREPEDGVLVRGPLRRRAAGRRVRERPHGRPRPVRRQRRLRPDGRGRDHALGRAAGGLGPDRPRPGLAAGRGGRALEPRVQGRDGGRRWATRACAVSSCCCSACRSCSARGCWRSGLREKGESSASSRP